jgi:hypothetical protein
MDDSELQSDRTAFPSAHPSQRIHSTLFPSWRSIGVDDWGAQSEAATKAEGSLGETALVACAPQLAAHHHVETE